MRVVVCGGGVIGVLLAYFLARRGVETIVVERTGIACAASGKSGGFLALDWCDGSALGPLARRSFALHAALAEEIGADWGYRRMTSYAGFAAAGEGKSGAGRGRKGAGASGWLAEAVTLDRPLGTLETTAQVHPALFTQAMMRAAEVEGARLQIGRVTGVLRNGARIAGARLGGETIEADAVVIAMGPWSIAAAGWLPLPRIFGLKGHSLVFQTGADVPAEALFLDYAEEGGAELTPEVFPRADGTTYVCGVSSEGAVPSDPAEVAPDRDALARLEALSRRVSPVLAAAPIVARQACYRPVTQDGLPLIGAIPELAGAYVAAGHSVWGILNAPATGEALAELIAEGEARSVDLAAFDPGRLAPMHGSATAVARAR